MSQFIVALAITGIRDTGIQPIAIGHHYGSKCPKFGAAIADHKWDSGIISSSSMNVYSICIVS